MMLKNGTLQNETVTALSNRVLKKVIVWQCSSYACLSFLTHFPIPLTENLS